MRIMNGGLELGLMEAIGEENLSEESLKRKRYLDSLPKGKWITLDEKGLALSDEEAIRLAEEKMKRFRVVPKKANQNAPSRTASGVGSALKPNQPPRQT